MALLPVQLERRRRRKLRSASPMTVAGATHFRLAEVVDASIGTKGPPWRRSGDASYVAVVGPAAIQAADNDDEKEPAWLQLGRRITELGNAIASTQEVLAALRAEAGIREQAGLDFRVCVATDIKNPCQPQLVIACLQDGQPQEWLTEAAFRARHAWLRARCSEMTDAEAGDAWHLASVAAEVSNGNAPPDAPGEGGQHAAARARRRGRRSSKPSCGMSRGAAVSPSMPSAEGRIDDIEANFHTALTGMNRALDSLGGYDLFQPCARGLHAAEDRGEAEQALPRRPWPDAGGLRGGS